MEHGVGRQLSWVGWGGESWEQNDRGEGYQSQTIQRYLHAVTHLRC